MASFKIERQTSTVYLDPISNDPVQGFTVSGVLYPWVEYFEIRVPSLDAGIIKPILDELIEQRVALDKLSEPDDEK